MQGTAVCQMSQTVPRGIKMATFLSEGAAQDESLRAMTILFF